MEGLLLKSFSEFPEDKMLLYGAIACNCGCRPSSLFEWNDVEEWEERLWFDSACVTAYLKASQGGKKHGLSRR